MSSKWNLSRREYFADMFAVPLFALPASAGAVAGHSAARHLIAAAAIGFMGWTLAEYVLHRWIFHTVYRRDHGRHHAQPKAWIGVKPWVSVVSLGFIAAVVVLGSPARDIGCAGFVGFALGYYAYLSIHTLIHHSATRLVTPWRAHHVLHHRGAGANYGVITGLWDRVFMTYRPVPPASAGHRDMAS